MTQILLHRSCLLYVRRDSEIPEYGHEKNTFLGFVIEQTKTQTVLLYNTYEADKDPNTTS